MNLLTKQEDSQIKLMVTKGEKSRRRDKFGVED